MGKVNKLSRRSDYKVRVEKNNENQTLIKEQWICSLSSYRGTWSSYIRKNKIAFSKY